MSSGSTQSIKQYSDSESDASELSDDELDRLEREIRRNNHPVKNSIVSFRESSVSVFLKSFFAKAEEKEDNDNEINANDERNNLNKTTTSYSIALTRDGKPKLKKKRRSYFFEQVVIEDHITEAQAISTSADIINAIATKLLHQVIDSDVSKEWIRMCKKELYSDDANDARTKEFVDYLMSKKPNENVGTYFTALLFNLKPNFSEENCPAWSYIGALMIYLCKTKNKNIYFPSPYSHARISVSAPEALVIDSERSSLDVLSAREGQPRVKTYSKAFVDDVHNTITESITCLNSATRNSAQAIPLKKGIEIIRYMAEHMKQPHWVMTPFINASNDYDVTAPWEKESISRLLYCILYCACINPYKPEKRRYEPMASNDFETDKTFGLSRPNTTSSMPAHRVGASHRASTAESSVHTLGKRGSLVSAVSAVASDCNKFLASSASLPALITTGSHPPNTAPAAMSLSSSATLFPIPTKRQTSPINFTDHGGIGTSQPVNRDTVIDFTNSNIHVWHLNIRKQIQKFWTGETVPPKKLPVLHKTPKEILFSHPNFNALFTHSTSKKFPSHQECLDFQTVNKLLSSKVMILNVHFIIICLEAWDAERRYIYELLENAEIRRSRRYAFCQTTTDEEIRFQPSAISKHALKRIIEWHGNDDIAAIDWDKFRDDINNDVLKLVIPKELLILSNATLHNLTFNTLCSIRNLVRREYNEDLETLRKEVRPHTEKLPTRSPKISFHISQSGKELHKLDSFSTIGTNPLEFIHSTNKNGFQHSITADNDADIDISDDDEEFQVLFSNVVPSPHANDADVPGGILLARRQEGLTDDDEALDDFSMLENIAHDDIRTRERTIYHSLRQKHRRSPAVGTAHMEQIDPFRPSTAAALEAAFVSVEVTSFGTRQGPRPARQSNIRLDNDADTMYYRSYNNTMADQKEFYKYLNGLSHKLKEINASRPHTAAAELGSASVSAAASTILGRKARPRAPSIVVKNDLAMSMRNIASTLDSIAELSAMHRDSPAAAAAAVITAKAPRASFLTEYVPDQYSHSLTAESADLNLPNIISLRRESRPESTTAAAATAAAAAAARRSSIKINTMTYASIADSALYKNWERLRLLKHLNKQDNKPTQLLAVTLKNKQYVKTAAVKTVSKSVKVATSSSKSASSSSKMTNPHNTPQLSDFDFQKFLRSHLSIDDDKALMIRKLQISGILFAPFNLKPFFEKCSNLSFLVHLNLSGSQITDSVCHSLLMSLISSGCHLTMKALELSDCLLSFSNNTMEPLMKFSHLRLLDLSINFITLDTTQQADLFKNILVNMPNLHSLYIGGNRIQNRGLQFILDIILLNLKNLTDDEYQADDTSATNGCGAGSINKKGVVLNSGSDSLGLKLRVLDVTNCFITSYNSDCNLVQTLLTWMEKISSYGYLGTLSDVTVSEPNPDWLHMEELVQQNGGSSPRLGKYSRQMIKSSLQVCQFYFQRHRHGGELEYQPLTVMLGDNIISQQERYQLTDMTMKCDLSRYIHFDFEGKSKRSVCRTALLRTTDDPVRYIDVYSSAEEEVSIDKLFV